MPTTKAKSSVLNRIKETLLTNFANSARTSNYYIHEDIFNERQEIPVPRQKVVAKRPTVMAFADDAPLYNWAHPCRYLLHDAETGELYQEINAQFPPFARESDIPKSFYAFHMPIKMPEVKIQPLQVIPRWWYWFKGNRYAILFSGMSNNRHTNDLEFAYRMLRNVYGFPAQNITVLNYDGTLNYSGNPQPAVHWPGNNTNYTMPVNGPGTKAKLLAAIDALKTKLKPNDLLFIHTNNHGGHNGVESDLCCYPNWDSLGVTEFTNKLGELPKYNCLMVMMEQCHSGGFNAKVIQKSTANNTSIASACLEPNNSIGGADFDPFARDWIAAMNGLDPYNHNLQYNPDVNGNGKVTSKEAFDYANAIHDPYDTPVFSYKNSGSGCWLGQDIFWLKPYEFIDIRKVILKHWPEPDPEPFITKYEEISPKITSLKEKLETDMLEMNKKFEEQVDKLF